MLVKKILQERFTTTVWSDDPVPQEDLQYVLDCAYIAPSKQCVGPDKCIAITNSPKGLEFKKWITENIVQYDLEGKVNGKHIKAKYLNGQYTAPILLAWLVNNDSTQIIPKINGEEVVSAETPSRSERGHDCFVAATCAMFAAQERGLNTGFASCDLRNIPEVAEKLGYPDHQVIVTLGVGYAADTSNMEKIDPAVVVRKRSDDILYVVGNNILPGQPHFHRDHLKRSYDQIIQIL